MRPLDYNIAKPSPLVKRKKQEKSNFLLSQKLDGLSHSVDNLTDTLSRLSSSFASMAHNAVSYTTLGAGDRATRSVDPCPQCGVDKTAPRAKPERGFSEPEPPTGGEAYSGCYVPLIPQYVIKYLDEKLRRAEWISDLRDDERMCFFSGAVTGNKVYAWRQERRVDLIFKVMNWDVEKTLFVTLTHSYVKTEKGRRESWKYFGEQLPKYLRKLRNAGMGDYFLVLEAHKDGGCHAHIICQWNRKFKTFEDSKGKLRITSKLRQYLKDSWQGDVDVERLRDADVGGYLKKYVGKYSHIEYALRRAKRGWAQDDDKRHIDADVKKLWTHYYCDKLAIRRFRCSKMGKEAKQRLAEIRKAEAAQAADLVNNMNKPTEENKPKTVWRGKLPRHITMHPDFEPYNGMVDPDSPCGRLVMAYIDRKRREYG